MVRQMQMRRSAVSVFGALHVLAQIDFCLIFKWMCRFLIRKILQRGRRHNPKLVHKLMVTLNFWMTLEFYQQLLKEFFETIDPASCGKTIRASHT
ncbi:unnamed protein product [Malus baccata var. baccata]